MSEFPDDQHFEDAITAAEIVATFHQAADQRLATLYPAQPALHAYAQEQGTGLVAAFREQYSEPLSPDVVESLETAYTKLYFTFTDPQDHADTPSFQTLLEITVEAMFDDNEELVGMATLGVRLNFLASQLFLLRATLAERGELAGIPFGQQLAYVKGRLELLYMPDTSYGDPEADEEN